MDLDTHHITNDTDAHCSDLFNFSPLCVFKWLLDMHRLCSNDTDEPARIWILAAWLGQRRRTGSRRHWSALGGGTRLLPVLVSVKIISPPPFICSTIHWSQIASKVALLCTHRVHLSSIMTFTDIYFVKERWLMFGFPRKLWQFVNCDNDLTQFSFNLAAAHFEGSTPQIWQVMNWEKKS